MADTFLYDALCLGAHPDDVEMAMGGTVAALSAAGRKVMILSLTRGEMGTWGSPALRAEEAAEAARILGCDHRILDLPDSRLSADPPTRERVARLLRELRPRLLFAPWPHSRASHMDGRANVDHLACGILARDAAKLARLGKALDGKGEAHAVQRVYYYMLPAEPRPTFAVDVSEHEETLIEAISAYRSQMDIGRGGRSLLDILLLDRRATGSRLHVALAEPFLCEDVVGGSAEQLFQL